MGDGLDVGEVGARLRLCEAHGSRPFALKHLGDIKPLQIFCGKTFDEMGRTVGETGSHVKGLACPIHEVIDDDSHHMGEALSPVFGIPGSRKPALLAKKPEGLFELRWTGDLPLLKGYPLSLPDLLKGVHHALGKVNGFTDQQIQRLFVEFSVSMERTERGIVELIFQDKEDIFLIDLKMCHGHTLMNIGKKSYIYRE
jgi:hypothetical protein